MAGLVAFLATGCASFAVGKRRPFGWGHALVLIVFSDVFAVLAFTFLFCVVVPLRHPYFPDSVTPLPRPAWDRAAVTAWFVFVGGLTVGNWASRGIGFVVAMPPAIWLLWRDRRAAKPPAD